MLAPALGIAEFVRAKIAGADVTVGISRRRMFPALPNRSRFPLESNPGDRVAVPGTRAEICRSAVASAFSSSTKSRSADEGLLRPGKLEELVLPEIQTFPVGSRVRPESVAPFAPPRFVAKRSWVPSELSFAAKPIEVTSPAGVPTDVNCRVGCSAPGVVAIGPAQIPRRRHFPLRPARSIAPN